RAGQRSRPRRLRRSLTREAQNACSADQSFRRAGIVLELADLPKPSAPSAGQVLIGVEHAPIKMNDLYLIQGLYPVRPSLPSVVGNEGVGRVLTIGRGVDSAAVIRHVT